MTYKLVQAALTELAATFTQLITAHIFNGLNKLNIDADT